nr:hypothetical protein [Rhizobium rhizogenes]
MNARNSIAATIAASIVLSSCAGVTVRPVTSKLQEGIRYYKPEVLLALQQTSDGKGSTTCDVVPITVPSSEEYAITFSAGMGTANVTPTLHDGWRLDSLSAQVDSKTSENITAFATLLKSIPQGLLPAKEKDGAKKQVKPLACSGIFSIVRDGSGRVIGFKELSLRGY